MLILKVLFKILSACVVEFDNNNSNNNNESTYLDDNDSLTLCLYSPRTSLIYVSIMKKS